MSIEEKIEAFIKSMEYDCNPHVLGVLFYGSYLTGFNLPNSDIDLHVIFDDYEKDRLIRGNKIIDGTRIEYFEKPISDVYLTVEEDYYNQNNASLTIFGTSKIIYEKDRTMQELQAYVKNFFNSPLPPLSSDEAKEAVSIINNRMEKLEKYAKEDDPFFEHLYHLTIDKIRRFYHSLIGSPRMGTAKCFRIYTDKDYREAFCSQNIPEQLFRELYFLAVGNASANKLDKFYLLEKLYNYAKRNIFLENNYRIHIKSRNIDLPGDSLESVKYFEEEAENYIPIPTHVLEKVSKFIEDMNYLDNAHCLGVIVYGSSLTGFNTQTSDIDLHVIFDDTKSDLIRGLQFIDGTKLEYFEKPISDVYTSIDNGFVNQDNAFLSMIGNGTIVFERDQELSFLRQYARARFSLPMPPLSEEEVKEYVSIIDNRMEKLEMAALENSPYFDHLWHLAIDKIRKFYHKRLGLPKIQTSKVLRVYTDEDYRKSMYKENPDEKFVKMYIDLVTTTVKDNVQRLLMIKEFYKYAARDVSLGDDYRILIRSRHNVNVRN